MIKRKGLLHLVSLVVISFSTLACQAYISANERAVIGMTVHVRGAGAAAIERQFDLMAAMNVTWVRMDIDWSAVETIRGQLDWTDPDKIVKEAAAHRMKVLAVLGYTPPWATPSGASKSRAGHLSDYAAFARVAAERYAPHGVSSWQIWNEPNTKQFWPPSPDADEYGDVFRAAATAIRNVEPQATLLLGGLSRQTGETGAEVPKTAYLEQLYANGTAQLADGVADHPYSFPAMPMNKNQPLAGGFKDLPTLHAVMDRHGDGRKKIWITEFGAPTGIGPYAVSEDAQAAALLQARRQVGAWEWAGPLIYYELVDGGTDPADKEQNFGVLRENLTPKPAALALMETAQT